MGCPRSPTPLSQDLTGHHPTQKAPRPEIGKSNSAFFPGKRKLKPKPKRIAWAVPWLHRLHWSVAKSPQSSWSLSLVGTAIMLIRGQS